MVPGRERAGTTGRADKSSNLSVADTAGGLFDRIAGDVPVETVIGHQLELREDDILFRLAYIFAVRALQGQNHVRLGPRRQIKFTAVLANAFVALLAHRVRHNDNGLIALQCADVGRPDAEIACAGPNDAAGARSQAVERLGFCQRCIGRPDLHRTAGESTPAENDDVGLNSGQLLRQYDVLYISARILPIDVEEVERCKFVADQGG